MASATSLMNQPGRKPAPTLNTDLNLANEISLVSEVSNIQMMKGINRNRMKPLIRCRIDTQPAGGRRYEGRSVMALMFLNSGRLGLGGEASSVMDALSWM